MERRLVADLEAMGLFVRIVQHGSLSGAGRALGVPKATLSRRLSELEHLLGCALLRRSTRAQSLTAEGRALYDRVAPLLVEAERAATDIQAASEEPAGLVRLSAAVGFGALVLMLSFLWVPPVQRTQEARVLETAREMMYAPWRGWLIPKLNGQPRLEKPPL